MDIARKQLKRRYNINNYELRDRREMQVSFLSFCCAK